MADTPEQRMWYEASQLDDLIFFDIPDPLLGKLAERPGFVRAIAPIAFLRGVERPIPTIIRSAMKHLTVLPTLSPKPSMSTRNFGMYGDPWYYDTRMVADSKVIPLAPATTGNAFI